MIYFASLQKRTPAVVLSATLLSFATALQIYAVYSALALATDTSLVRYVANNELILMWFSLATIPLQWCVIHLVAKAYFWKPALILGGNPTKINWLPVGTRLQCILWSGYAVILLALSVSTSITLYRLQLRKGFTALVMAYAIPIATSFLALPSLITKLLRHLSCRRQHEQHKQHQQQQQKQIHQFQAEDCSVIPTPLPEHERKAFCSHGHFDTVVNASTLSETSEETGTSLTTKYSPGDLGSIHSGYFSQKINGVHGKDGLFSPTSIANSQQSTSVSMSTLEHDTQSLHRMQTRSARMTRNIAYAILRVTTCGPLAVAAALFSIALNGIILSSVTERYQHILSAPANLPDLASSFAEYSDGTRHSVSFSISCKGTLPPELKVPSARGLPQQATILIEHISGFSSLTVKSLQNALSEQNKRVCIYDRPGYMLSPQGYAPIGIDQMEKALGDALESAGVHGPYYLVGHHSGSENSHVFLRKNRRSVVGMALLYPTETALLGLMSPAVNITERKSMATGIIENNSVSETTPSLAALNTQRMLSALGIWQGNALAEDIVSAGNQKTAEWAIKNTQLAQAQYYESLQRTEIMDTLEYLDYGSASTQKQLPVILFGVNANKTAFDSYLNHIDERYKVEIPNAVESQSPTPSRITRQILWHIARIS